MADLISYPGLASALFLPWLAGSIWVRWLLSRGGCWNGFIVAGQGYFLGIFATTLMIRLSDWMGWGLHFRALAAALALVAIAGIALQFARRAPARPAPVTAPLHHWQVTVVLILIALLAWRYLGVLQEMLLRPLYAWDAWMNWAPKAIVWFNLGELVPFVDPEHWLVQGQDAGSYTLGNSQASVYPPTVPLIQLWSMMGAGTWDHSYLFLPWIMAAINLGLSLYGYLRLNGVHPLLATIACYMLLSMPYYNVHTVLAGYADIWLAAAFGLAVFSLREWNLGRSWTHGLLFFLMTVMCSQLKVPGIVLAGILLLAFLRSLVNASHRRELLAACSLGLAVWLLFVFGLDMNLPRLGHLTITSDLISLPLLGSYHLEFHNVWGALRQSMFAMINWHTTWYLLVLVALIKIRRGDIFKQAAPDTLAIAGALAFVWFVFFLTRHHEAATSFTTLNRALLYPVPALMFYLFLAAAKREKREPQCTQA